MVIPPLYGALLKNEQDVHLFERLAFLRRGQRARRLMFAGFIVRLRAAGVPASITEYLTLLAAMKAGVADYSVEDFYYLARATLVKDERHLDRFDRVFAHFFNGLGAVEREIVAELPEEWLRKLAEKLLTPEEMAQIEALGGFDKLMETLRERLAEQKGRHQGGSKWIGTAGTSPFGAYGYNPEGVRIGQDKSPQPPRREGVGQARIPGSRRHGRARHPRHEAGAAPAAPVRAPGRGPTELDMPDTIRSTAHNAGLLDLKMVPERHNTVKVLLFLDIGGSMDDHVEAARSCSPPRAPNSSIWNTSTSTTAPMSGCGRTTGGAA